MNYRGLENNIEVMKYRFNRNFNLIGSEEFLKDLFNDRHVITSFGPLRGLGVGQCTGVNFTHMNCNVINMSFYDLIQENNIVHTDSTIRANYEEYVEGI
jgi:hypothetical protein